MGVGVEIACVYPMDIPSGVPAVGSAAAGVEVEVGGIAEYRDPLSFSTFDDTASAPGLSTDSDSDSDIDSGGLDAAPRTAQSGARAGSSGRRRAPRTPGGVRNPSCVRYRTISQCPPAHASRAIFATKY